VRQRAEERRRHALQVGLRLAHDVAADELGRVLEHVDEAVQLAQHVVRNVARGARLAVQEDRDLLVAAADFLTKARSSAMVFSGLVAGKLLVVDRQDEGRRPALLLGERGQVAVAGDAETSKPSTSMALASARMPRPEAFSERKSSSMMMTGK
jgi:hypothetical protein